MSVLNRWGGVIFHRYSDFIGPILYKNAAVPIIMSSSFCHRLMSLSRFIFSHITSPCLFHRPPSFSPLLFLDYRLPQKVKSAPALSVCSPSQLGSEAPRCALPAVFELLLAHIVIIPDISILMTC